MSNRAAIAQNQSASGESIVVGFKCPLAQKRHTEGRCDNRQKRSSTKRSISVGIFSIISARKTITFNGCTLTADICPISSFIIALIPEDTFQN